MRINYMYSSVCDVISLKAIDSACNYNYYEKMETPILDYMTGNKYKITREDRNMELKDTVELMKSTDWKDRFVAEYLQTKIRYNKLHKLIVKREVGKHGFETPISLESWKTQANYMGLYLYELEKQAVLHDIELPEV